MGGVYSMMSPNPEFTYTEKGNPRSTPPLGQVSAAQEKSVRSLDALSFRVRVKGRIKFLQGEGNHGEIRGLREQHDMLV